jgi:cyclopropane fatty-acyl-phospholipid synthase-like methyltransferase
MRLRPCLLALLAASLLPFAEAQAPAPPVTHPTSTPYAGDLSIFDDPGRAQRLQIDHVMDTLHLRPGKVIADIGAGGGWFSVRAARRVAPGGKVLAEDINPKAMDYIRDRAAKEHLNDIETVLGTPDDPRLAPDSLDAALMLRVYHEIAHPPVLLGHLYAAMRPGGLFGIIDHAGRGDDHGINDDVVRAEVERSGFRFLRRYDFTSGDQNDYFLVFVKR